MLQFSLRRLLLSVVCFSAACAAFTLTGGPRTTGWPLLIYCLGTPLLVARGVGLLFGRPWSILTGIILFIMILLPVLRSGTPTRAAQLGVSQMPITALTIDDR